MKSQVIWLKSMESIESKFYLSQLISSKLVARKVWSYTDVAIGISLFFIMSWWNWTQLVHCTFLKNGLGSSSILPPLLPHSPCRACPQAWWSTTPWRLLDWYFICGQRKNVFFSNASHESNFTWNQLQRLEFFSPHCLPEAVSWGSAPAKNITFSTVAI